MNTASPEVAADLYRQGDRADFVQEHRAGGSFGLTMFTVDQDAGEFTDPPFANVFFTQVLRAPRFARLDFGDGPRVLDESVTGKISPQPANTECHFAMDRSHRIRVLGLGVGLFGEIIERSGFGGDPLLPMYANAFGSAPAYAAFETLWQAMQRDDPAASLAIDGAFLTFLAHYLPSAGTSLSPEWTPGAEDARLRRVLDYIEANLCQQLLMDELAAIACLSPSHFARVFRETFGRTAHRYVTERRIDRAKRALATTRDPVTLIAFDCGFSTSAHFATVFRQHVGVSPSAYRAQRH
jgi:AraC-like DNA-binding protein